MKTGRDGLSVVQVNYAFDKSLADPDALLDRYATLTGWADAIAAAGASSSRVVQRFARAAQITRDAVEYTFVDGDLSGQVAALNPDLVHVNGLSFGARTWRLRRALPARTAIVVQNHSDTGPMGWAPVQRAVGVATRRAVDAFLFAAPGHAERWCRAGFIARDQQTYEVMEASSRFLPMPRDAARSASGVAGNPALLWVGRLNANKDPLTVLDGFEMFVADAPGATLTMIYTAEDLLDAVRRRVARSPVLATRVRLIGAVVAEALPAFFSSADLFVLGSHHEGSGYAVIEALACGLPPVVTDIPSFRVLTGGGAVGALWTAGDPAACARALAVAWRHASPAARGRARQHFDAHFSWQAIGRRALGIYSDVARRRLARFGDEVGNLR